MKPACPGLRTAVHHLCQGTPPVCGRIRDRKLPGRFRDHVAGGKFPRQSLWLVRFGRKCWAMVRGHVRRPDGRRARDCARGAAPTRGGGAISKRRPCRWRSAVCLRGPAGISSSDAGKLMVEPNSECLALLESLSLQPGLPEPDARFSSGASARVDSLKTNRGATVACRQRLGSRRVRDGLGNWVKSHHNSS